MTGRAIDLLARLHRHAVDRRRGETAALAAELQRTDAAMADEARRRVLEHGVAFALPGGPRPLAPLTEASRRRTGALVEQRAKIEIKLADAQAALMDAAQRWKSLDTAMSALRAAAERAAILREQREVEEAALLRRAAVQNSGASATSSPSSAGPNLIWQDSRELSRNS